MEFVSYLAYGGPVVQDKKSGASLVPKAINVVGGVDTIVKVAARNITA